MLPLHISEVRSALASSVEQSNLLVNHGSDFVNKRLVRLHDQILPTPEYNEPKVPDLNSAASK